MMRMGLLGGDYTAAIIRNPQDLVLIIKAPTLRRVSFLALCHDQKKFRAYPGLLGALQGFTWGFLISRGLAGLLSGYVGSIGVSGLISQGFGRIPS